MANPASTIEFVNTNGPERATFVKAVLSGKAPNGGLWIPETYHQFSLQEIQEMAKMTLTEIAYLVLRPYIAVSEIPHADLWKILSSIYDYKVMPLDLVRVGNRYVLRLDQGPTLAFKDVGMLFLLNVLDYLLKKSGGQMGNCAATSGDTGGSASENSEGLENILCIPLFIKGKPSSEQRVFMTTNDNSIAIQANEGTFDTCQALFNQLLDDKEFAKDITGNPNFFGTVNSINIGRLLPQIVYVFWAYSRLLQLEIAPMMVPFIPSGNLGDSTATEMARRMGVPIPKIGIAQNDNNVFDNYLKSGKYQAMAVANTDSQSMDIGDPNNFPRLVHLFHGHMDGQKVLHRNPDIGAMREIFFSHTVSNDEHRKIIHRIFAEYGYESDPHGAAGHGACDFYMKYLPDGWIPVVYQTANPDKFRDLMEDATGKRPTPTAILERKFKMKETIHEIFAPPDYVKVPGQDQPKAVFSQAQYLELQEILALEIPERLTAKKV